MSRAENYATSHAAPNCALSISAASQPDLQVQQNVSHDNLGPLHQQDGAVQRQAGSLQAGSSEQQRQGTARTLPAEQEGQHLACNSAPQGAHGSLPASGEDSAGPLPESGSRAAALVAYPVASMPATEAGGQQQAPARQALVPTGEVASSLEATCNRSAESSSSTAAVLLHLSHGRGSPAQQEQGDVHAARQAERASALREERPGPLQIRQTHGLPAQQEHDPAALLSAPKERGAAHAPEGHDPTAWRPGHAPGMPAQQEYEPASLPSRQIEAADPQQGHVPPACASEVAQEVVAQQEQDPAALLPRHPRLPAAQQGQQQGPIAVPSGQVELARQSEDPGALLSRQVLLPAAQQGQLRIALPSGQVEVAGQSEEPGALLSRQAEVARQREAQRQSRATHMQSLQAKCVRQLHAAGEKQLQRQGAG